MKSLIQYVMFEIIFSINGSKIIQHTIYDMYLNDYFYLVKINKQPPNISKGHFQISEI